MTPHTARLHLDAVVGAVLLCASSSAVAQNTEARNQPTDSERIHWASEDSLHALASKGVTFTIPKGWTEPVTIGSPPVEKFIIKGVEYRQKEDIVYIGPKYQHDGALIHILTYE